MNPSSPFEWIVDLEVLRAFPQRYARAVDERDHDALVALFDPDGSVDGTRGQQPVSDYLESMRAMPRAYNGSTHLMGDPLIELEAGVADVVGEADEGRAVVGAGRQLRRG